MKITKTQYGKNLLLKGVPMIIKNRSSVTVLDHQLKNERMGKNARGC